ncbi:MAG: putative Diheme Cytochrome c [Candidatus Nitrospira kreftii]|uniref:Putative Diheme Cytochrome c n=1 Tax=Candidatus Nitrospira kreftii TaxID=2652173 RepID=A0A7S8IZR4_9BACT|nr:MAG: putative Diheme Cytochrome c [Candidatus Nitrospira kreftii]
MKAARLGLFGLMVGVIGVAAVLTGGCASEQEKRGHELYTHYCSDCHGESGKQNQGFNWSAMPDPKPKDLSNKSEMGTFTDQELFDTISRDMLDTSEEGGDEIGDDDFAVPTMPTFKYTLSEDEIWAIVGYVRTLHDMKMEFNVEARKASLDEGLKSAQAKFEQAKQAYEAAEKKASDEAERKSEELNKDVDVDESAYAAEQEAMGQAKKELDTAQVALNNFSTRSGRGVSIPRPDLTVKPAETAALIERGKRLYENKYGCNGCHSLADEGGKIGPALDRAGFRLNATWIYRWLKNPQAMDSATRMPALGLSDADAKAVTMYVATLRAPKAEPVEEKPVENP